MGISEDGLFLFKFDVKTQKQTWKNAPERLKFVDIVVGWDFWFLTIENVGK